MNTSVEKLPGCQAKVQVDMPADTVSAERDKIIAAFTHQAKLPGFRPGKVPKSVIEKRFKEDIKQELLKRLVNTGCSEGFKKEELKVLHAEANDASINDDGSFTCVVNVSLVPEIPLPEYSGIVVKLPEIEVKEENIDNAIERVREKVADFENVEDRAVIAGDFVVIDYKGRIDESPIAEAVPKAASYFSEGSDVWVEVSEEGFLPGFAIQLIGAEKGGTATVTIRFPADFDVFELQGIEATYDVEVKEIKLRNLPELNDEFSEKMLEGKKLTDAREMIRENLREQMDQRVEELKTSQILEFLHTNSDFELPQVSVSRQAQMLVNQTVERGQMRGLSDEEILAHEQEILGGAEEQARLDVKTRFLLLEIAHKEELEVTQRELAAQVSAIAQRNKVAPKKMAKDLKESGALDGLREQILAAKALDFLKANASVETIEQDVPEEASDTAASESDNN